MSDPNHLASKSGAEDRPHVLPSVKIEAVRQGSTNEDVSLNLCRGSKRRSRQTEDAESEQGQIPVRSSVLLDQRKCRNGRNKPVGGNRIQNPVIKKIWDGIGIVQLDLTSTKD